jgi:hypothetical protein
VSGSLRGVVLSLVLSSFHQSGRALHFFAVVNSRVWVWLGLEPLETACWRTARMYNLLTWLWSNTLFFRSVVFLLFAYGLFAASRSVQSVVVDMNLFVVFCHIE